MLTPCCTSSQDPGTSFREKQQVRLLLHYVRNAITEPLQRIPMTSAAFAAEAACIQMHPEHQLYGALNKFLLKRPALDLEVGTFIFLFYIDILSLLDHILYPYLVEGTR